MATQLDYKRKSLQSIIKSLQCFKCKDVPGFKEEQQNRYSCVDESHQLCEKCKTTCECGSLVGKCPNPTTKQILEELPVYCPHYKTGCHETFLLAESLDDHQQGCIFRPVFCPYVSCKQILVLFKDVIEHLTQVHESKFWFDATENKFSGDLDTSKNNDGAFWKPIGIKIGSGIYFFLVGQIINRIAYFWLYVMASPLQAKKYAYTLSVIGKNGNTFITFNDYAKPLDEGKDEIIENQLVFMIGTEAIMKIRNENEKLPVEITIRDLKEEAKDDEEESGVEDESE